MRVVDRNALQRFAQALFPGLTHGVVTLKMHDGQVRDVQVQEAVQIEDPPPRTSAAMPRKR